MSARGRRDNKKKRRIVLIALLAIAIAETGYILYSFGILTGGGAARTHRISSLNLALLIACRFSLGSPQLCETDIARTLLSSAKYIVIRYVDLLSLQNLTSFVRDTVSLARNSDVELVDVLLTPTLDLSSKIAYEVRSAVSRPGRAYVIYPLTLDQSTQYYSALLNELVLVLSLNITTRGNITRLSVVRSGNNFILRPASEREKVKGPHFVVLNLTYTFLKPLYVSNNRSAVLRALSILLSQAVNKTTLSLCQETNKTKCKSITVLSRLYAPIIQGRKVSGLIVYMMFLTRNFTKSAYINVTLRSQNNIKLSRVEGVLLRSRPIELVIVGSRLNRKIIYALIAPTEKEVKEFLSTLS